MRFVKDSFEYIPQGPGVEGMYKMMEHAARLCYKTEDLIKDGSAERIINDVIIPRGHTSILEFGTVYLYREFDLDTFDEEGEDWVDKYINDRFSRVRSRVYDKMGRLTLHTPDAPGTLKVWITTTYRTIMQGYYTDPIDSILNGFNKDWKEDLQYMCEPMQEHYKRICYKFVMDRVGSQSVERHRGRFGISYAQESTRYINYNRDKFDHNITYCVPSKFYELVDYWSRGCDSLTKESYEYIKDLSFEEQREFLLTHDRGWKCYEDSLKRAEDDYMYLVGTEEWKPEDARGVLPLDVKTEFMMCGYLEDWKMFFFRRTDKHAHPHIQKISKELELDFKTRVNRMHDNLATK